MTCGIIVHEAKKLSEYFNIVKLAVRYLPDQLKPKTKTDTKGMYEFTHRFDGAPLDSSIYVATDIRGGTVQKLHVTESAYIKDRAKLKASSKQAVPLTGTISEETTGNGFNEFFDDFMEAHKNEKPGDYDYKSYFYSWVENPEYTLPGTIDEYREDELEVKKTALEQFNIVVTDGQLLWRRWKMNELRQSNRELGLSGLQLFKQEYPLTLLEAFQSGAGNVFDTEKLEKRQATKPFTNEQAIVWLSEHYRGDVSIIEKFNSLDKLGVKFWRLPEYGQKYLLGCDPSDGTGGDNGVIDIWSEDLEQCAQFHGNVLPDELAEINSQLGYFYNEAYAGIENNMLSTILFFSKLYSNYYYEVKIDEKTQKRTKKIGYNTNSKTRNPMIDDFLIFDEDDALTIHSSITLSEMRTFVKKDGGKREHAVGKNDDALFAAFIAVQMRKYNKPKARGFAKNPF